jgi:hypothetical protein
MKEFSAFKCIIEGFGWLQSQSWTCRSHRSERLVAQYNMLVSLILTFVLCIFTLHVLIMSYDGRNSDICRTQFVYTYLRKFPRIVTTV